MSTDMRVRAASDLFRFLGSDAAKRRGALPFVLDRLRSVAPFDCGSIIEWDAVAERMVTPATIDYPPELVACWERNLAAEPLYISQRPDTPAIRVRDAEPHEQYGPIWEETFVKPGFAEGLTRRLWSSDGRCVGCLAVGVIGTSQPDDLAVDLIDLIAPRLGALLDPVPQLRPLSQDLADGSADGLIVTRHGRVRRLTDGADAELVRLDGPLWPLIHAVADRRSPATTAVVLVADRVLSVALQAGEHGVLVLHRTIPAPFGLSARELQVLHGLGDGATNRELAARLAITPHTVATHVQRLLAKTGCPNRTAATSLAARLNLTVNRPAGCPPARTPPGSPGAAPGRRR